jgi:hypothetical protein
MTARNSPWHRSIKWPLQKYLFCIIVDLLTTLPKSPGNHEQQHTTI